MTRGAAALAAALTLGGCLPTVTLPAASADPRFDPVAFFAGETEGSGTLTTLTGQRQALQVASVGRTDGVGGLVLDQRIALVGEPVRMRRWTIRPVAPGRFTGTLTEAIGPVEGLVTGNRMTIRYRTKDYAVRQVLALQPGGAVRNRLDIVKWGLNVARLDETILRKERPAR